MALGWVEELRLNNVALLEVWHRWDVEGMTTMVLVLAKSCRDFRAIFIYMYHSSLVDMVNEILIIRLKLYNE